MQSLRSFTWFSRRYLLSTDTSYGHQFRCFLPSFFCCYLFSKWNIYFFILVFSDPILFSLFLFLCSTFPVFYFLSFPSVFLCTSSTFSFSFSLFLCITSTFFLAAFYLFPLTLPLFILCLSSIMFPLLFSLTFCAFVFFLLSFLSACSYFLYLLSLILFSAFSAYFSTFFFLFYFSYFTFFSTLFNCLVLILDFNYCKFSLLFIFL